MMRFYMNFSFVDPALDGHAVISQHIFVYSSSESNEML